MEWWQEEIEIQRQLDNALGTLRENGIKACEAERQYQLAKSKKMFELKEAGYPVTFIEGAIKGISEIADLDYHRNVADVVYKANQEAINIKKKELDVLEESIRREFYTNARND